MYRGLIYEFEMREAREKAGADISIGLLILKRIKEQSGLKSVSEGRIAIKSTNAFITNSLRTELEFNLRNILDQKIATEYLPHHPS